MKRLMAALALAAVAVLPAACDREADKAEDDAPTVATETAPSATPPASASAEPPAATPAGAAAAPNAPPFAVLYPGATPDEPAVTASGPAGPGGLVTYTTEADPETVIAFYRERAESAGLSPVMAMNQGEARAYGAASADAGANLQVVASPTEAGETSVQLSWSAGQ